MTERKEPAPAPPVVSASSEPNSYLAKFKESLARRWSYTRMETLYEEVDLATFLWCLARADESLAILRAITSAVPSPPALRTGGFNYNIWSPVAWANAYEARISAATGDARGAAVPRKRILEVPSIAPNRVAIEAMVKKSRALLEEAFSDRSVKWACQKLSRELGGLVLFGELAVAQHPFSQWYAVAEVEEGIDLGKNLLARRLSAAA